MMHRILINGRTDRLDWCQRSPDSDISVTV